MFANAIALDYSAMCQHFVPISAFKILNSTNKSKQNISSVFIKVKLKLTEL